MSRFHFTGLWALCMALVALSLPAAAYSSGGSTSFDKPEITSDTVWTGEVHVVKPVTVGKDATLTIKPGASILFATAAGLSVEGALKAEGSADAVISFGPDAASPEPGCWTGISITQAGDSASSLKYCRFEYADSVSVVAGKPPIRNCVIVKGVRGLVLQSRKSAPKITGCRISDIKDVGVMCQMGAAPEITGNTIERCGSAGIATSQESMPVIKGNTISECDAGIAISQSSPPIENNVLRKNKAGIVATQAGKEVMIRGNKAMDNEAGIVCRQFSNPTVEKNEITGNKQGLVCFMASSPLIRHNSIFKNDEGISCVQLCNPNIVANDIHNNNKGVYLDLSSYALVNGNNIYDNKHELELGNMSSDWERRVRNKPVRGVQAQNETRAMRGAAYKQTVQDDTSTMGYVDATGNWWGDAVTKEMTAKGPDANIDSLIDYYDLPTRTYEGYEGEYIQDKIKYEGWKTARIKDSGI